MNSGGLPHETRRKPVFETVLVGADDSQTARQAVVAAVAVAEMAGGKIHIVTVYDPKSVHVDDLPAELRYSTTVHPADSLLESLAQLAKERGLEVELHASTGTPAEAIVKIAEQEGVDLIVVGNKGMKGARRILGSVPNTVAHSAHCSVLIVDTEAPA
jgi:nucleotide-binding universal stress UspA family protein